MEVEAKFNLEPGAFSSLSTLNEVVGYSLGEARIVTDVDQYLDTVDYRILRAGYACRIRERNGRLIATLKSLSPAQTELHVREELETPLEPGAGDPSSWPTGPARELALRLTEGAPLETLFVIWQQRAVRKLAQADRQVAEWSLDQVETQAGGQSETHHELEVELKATGTTDDLNGITNALLKLEGVTPNPVSKFERAINLLDLDRTLLKPNGAASKPGKAGPGVEPNDTMAEAGRKILRFHFKRMKKNEAGARAGEDIEAVHDMRVATRRMRAALALFAPYYRPKTVKEWQQGLRQTTRALGGVRDLDVFLERAEQYRDKLTPTRQTELDPMFRHWQKRREQARAVMTHWLDSDNFEEFEQRFQTFVETPKAGIIKSEDNTIQPRLVRHIAPALIWEAYARVRAYEDILADAPIETWHALRIEGKRLRYTLEFFSEDLGPKAATLIATVTRMQDHLGNLNDADVDAQALTQFLAEYDGKDTELPAVRAYLSSRLAERARLRARFMPIWTAVIGPRFRRQLGLAVAYL